MNSLNHSGQAVLEGVVMSTYVLISCIAVFTAGVALWNTLLTEQLAYQHLLCEEAIATKPSECNKATRLRLSKFLFTQFVKIKSTPTTLNVYWSFYQPQKNKSPWHLDSQKTFYLKRKSLYQAKALRW